MDEKKDLSNVEGLEIEALTDDELDSVAGGTGVASCTCCTAGTSTTVIVKGDGEEEN